MLFQLSVGQLSHLTATEPNVHANTIFTRTNSTRKEVKEKKMVRVKFQLCLFFVGLLAFANAQNAGDTLVLVDNLAVRETHSIFFKNLQGKNRFTGVE